MIHYKFIFDDGTLFEFEVDEKSDPPVEHPDTQIPEWIELERYKCERCTLPKGSRKSCPAALAIKPIVEELATRVSYEKVKMVVLRDNSTLTIETSTQQAARSLIGLLLPLSDCPFMMKLRPMARLHLPMGSRMHTAVRFMGMYLVAQFIQNQRKGTPDWELKGLLEILENVHMVNHMLTARIRASLHMDATVNALVGLDFFANNVEWSIEDSLEELEPLFATMLDD